MSGFSGGGGLSEDLVLLLDGSNVMTGPVLTSDLEIRGQVAASPDDDFAGTELDTNLWTTIDGGGSGDHVVGSGYLRISSNQSATAMPMWSVKSNWTVEGDYDIRMEANSTATQGFIFQMVHIADEGVDADFTDYRNLSHFGVRQNNQSSTPRFTAWLNGSDSFTDGTFNTWWTQLRIGRVGNLFSIYYRNEATQGALPDLDNDTGWTLVDSVTQAPSREAGRLCISSANNRVDVYEFIGASGTFSGAAITGPLLELAGNGPVTGGTPVFEFWDGMVDAGDLAMSLDKNAAGAYTLSVDGSAVGTADNVLLLTGVNVMSGAIKTTNRQLEGQVSASPDDDFPGTSLNSNLWTEISQAVSPVAAVVSGGKCQLSSGAGLNTTGVVANQAIKSTWTCATDFDLRIVVDVTSGRWNSSNANIGFTMNGESSPTDAQQSAPDRADAASVSCNVDSSISGNQFAFWYDASQTFSSLLTAQNWIALRLVRSGNDFSAYYKNDTSQPTIDDDSGWTQVGSTQTFTPAAAMRMAIFCAGGAGSATYDVYEVLSTEGTYVGAPVSGPLFEVVGSGEIADNSSIFDIYDGTKSGGRRVLNLFKETDGDVLLSIGGVGLDDGTGIVSADGYDTGGGVYRPGMLRLLDVDGNECYLWVDGSQQLRFLTTGAKPTDFATDGTVIS